MKNFIIFTIMLPLAFACEDIHPAELGPLHEEDAHFIIYRSLQMESAIHRIKQALDDAQIDDEHKEEIEKEIEILEFNLGI